VVQNGEHDTVVQAGSIGGVHIYQAGDPADALASPVIATVDIEPSLSTLYVDDDPPRAMARSGDVHIITVEARTTRAVVLQKMRPVVVSRRPPHRACVEVRIGGIVTPRPFTADFDSDPPRLEALAENFPFSVSLTDVEQFRFVPNVTNAEVSWRLELDWLCAGQRGTTVIDDHGKPFEMYPSRVLWDGRDDTDLNWGCGMFHMPGCPAERLAALSRQGTVSIFREDTGTGLIRPDGGGTSLELRRSALADGVPGIRSGQRVTYVARYVAGQLEAAEVRPASGPPPTTPATPTAPDHHAAPPAETKQDLLAAAPAGDPDDMTTWPSFEVFAPRLEVVLDQVPAESAEPEPFRALVLRVLRYFNLSGKSQPGETMARGLYPRWVRALGANHPDTLALANRFAGFLYKLGQDTQAVELFKSTYDRRKHVLGENHPDTLLSATNFATVLSWEVNRDWIRELRADTLRRSREVLGENHHDTLLAAEALGRVHLKDENYAAARAIFEDSARRSRQTLGADHPGTLSPVISLAWTLRKLEDFEQARDLYQDALPRARGALGESHPLTRSAAEGLANTLRELGEAE
jgi:cold shock CspA family protein